MFKTEIYLLCLMHVIARCHAGEMVRSSLFLKNRGMHQGGLILRTEIVRYATACASLCMETDGCDTCNLGPEDSVTRRMQCELVTRNSRAVDVSGAGANGWVTYVKTDDRTSSQADPEPQAAKTIFPSQTDTDNSTASTPATTDPAQINFDCTDFSGTSGVYSWGSVPAGAPTSVYCDMETAGGGWTAIERHVDTAFNFNRSWVEYKHGFGDKNAEFWLGNECLHYLTKSRAYKLRFDLEDWDGNTAYAEYSSFVVESEVSNYTLRLGDYSGNASIDQADDDENGFLYHNNMQFSTFDRDNDQRPAACIKRFGYGGFWHNNCARVTPTNRGCDAAHCPQHGQHFFWRAWRGDSYSLKTITMTFRP